MRFARGRGTPRHDEFDAAIEGLLDDLAARVAPATAGMLRPPPPLRLWACDAAGWFAVPCRTIAWQPIAFVLGGCGPYVWACPVRRP